MSAEKNSAALKDKKKTSKKEKAFFFYAGRKPLFLVIAVALAMISVVYTIEAGLEDISAALTGTAVFLLFFAVFKTRKELKGLSVNTLAFVWSLLIFWLVQIAVSASVSRIFLSDLQGELVKNIWLGIVSGVVRIVFNILIIFSFIMLISSIFRTMKVGIVTVLVFSLIFGVANNFVVQARGREISFLDIKSIGTAVSVVGDYSFELEVETLTAIILALACIVHVITSDYPRFKGFKKSSKYFLTSVISLVVCVATVFGGVSLGYASKNYRTQGTEYNGYYLNFIYSIKNSRVKAPVTYSPGAIMNAVSKNDFSSLGVSPETNVIVIMNESFSDLKNVCDSSETEIKLVTDAELLPYWNSLENGTSTDENGKTQTVVKGNALSSVYGGNTANSEFEFLMGTSMAFLPKDTVVYNGKINQSNSYSIVNFFNDAGYKTIAVHPEYAENWSRNVIYKHFGFDETYFWDKFESDVTDEDMYRGHVSDATVYKKIIELYENREENEKFFTFAITMMNHGGYVTEDFKDTVNVIGDDQGEANEYLSSANEADASIHILLDYFKEVEEDTLIVFFGDHQPTMTDNFLEKYMGITSDSTVEEMQRMYTVPYMFWSNFEMESDINENVSSINYLSTEMLTLSGVSKSKYFDTLDDIKKTIPAMNFFGWYDIDGNFHSFSDKSDKDITEKEKEALELYEHLAYNLMFDDDNKMVNLFDTPTTMQTTMIVHSVGLFHDFRKAPKIFGVA